jgi:hypothetical protein
VRRALKKILTDPPNRPGQRCRVCGCPEIAEAVAEWAKARVEGGQTTLQAFYERYLALAFPGGPCRGSVRGHLVRCLLLDPSTGRPLR